MKYIFSFAVFMLPFLSKGQTVDTTISCGVAMRIIPFKTKYNDTVNARYMTLKVIEDDLKSRCVFYYTLIDNDCNVLASGNEQMTGNDYKSWNCSTVSAFLYVMDKAKVLPYMGN